MAKKKRRLLTGQNSIVLRTDQLKDTYETAAMIEEAGGQIMHMYGPRFVIGCVPTKAKKKLAKHASIRDLYSESIPQVPKKLSEGERIGLQAWNLRQSASFSQAKAVRPLRGKKWDMHGTTEPLDEVMGSPVPASENMSPYLIGSVAVGLVMVEGPTADLQFSEQEKIKIVAEVQEGLTWLGNQEPRASITWAYDIRTVRVDVAPDPGLSGYSPLERLWRNPALGQLGFSQNKEGVRSYVASLRTNLGTRWGYVAFFTKYRVHRFAYAWKNHLVMHACNGKWGPDNIDRVFAHETGHIFGCPDEYSNDDSSCYCNHQHGYLREINGNCERCADPVEKCIMLGNHWAMCSYTRTHLGWHDSDGDGTLDPVDPLANPTLAIDLPRLARRYPSVREFLDLQGLAPTMRQANLPVHESVPLFLLRRVLGSDQMADVEAALVKEEEQYLQALANKLAAVARNIKAQRRP